MWGRARVENEQRLRIADLPRERLAGMQSPTVSAKGAESTPIKVHRTAQAIGGERYWLACPGCSRLRTWLAVRGQRVGCRACFGLAYTSQCLSDMNRRDRRACALYDRINVTHGPMSRRQEPKPAGMHWTTYWRLYESAQAIDPWARFIKRRYRPRRGLHRRA